MKVKEFEELFNYVKVVLPYAYKRYKDFQYDNFSDDNFYFYYWGMAESVLVTFNELKKILGIVDDKTIDDYVEELNYEKWKSI